MSYKIVISKAGYNALTETNPNNLVFSSDYNTLKYYASGYVDIDYDRNTGGATVYSTSTVAHGLSYVPFFYGYVDMNSSGVFTPLPKMVGAIPFNESFYAYADATYVKFVCFMRGTSGASNTARFRYFIFKNRINV